MPRLRAAFHGDDFTGGVDALLQFARRGWTGRLFVGPPDPRVLERAAAQCDVVGIVGIVRSLPAGERDADASPVLESLACPIFAIGSGGLSRAIAAADGAPAPRLPSHGANRGPVLAVSDSPSSQTRRQLDAAADAHWFVQPLELEASRAAAQLDWVLSALRAGRSVALTSDDVDTAATAPRGLEATAAAAATVAAGAAAAGATRRLIVSGDGTSSRVIPLLGIQSLSIAANPWEDIVLLTAHAEDPALDGLELLIGDEQAGAFDLFERIRALSD